MCETIATDQTIEKVLTAILKLVLGAFKIGSPNSGSLWEVNALKISANDTDVAQISAIGTDLVGTSFQCRPSGTDFQCILFGALILSTTFFSTLISSTPTWLALIFSTLSFSGADFPYYILLRH